MSGKIQKEKYCYRCEDVRRFTNWKNGIETKIHCSYCGTYEWYNDGELRAIKNGDREYLNKMMVQRWNF